MIISSPESHHAEFINIIDVIHCEICHFRTLRIRVHQLRHRSMSKFEINGNYTLMSVDNSVQQEKNIRATVHYQRSYEMISQIDVIDIYGKLWILSV